MAAANADSTFLVLVIDTNINLWQEAEYARPDNGTALLEPASFVSQLAVFVNAFLMLHENNRVAAFAMGDRASTVIYEPPELRSTSGHHASSSGAANGTAAVQHASLLPADAILQGIQEFVEETERIRAAAPNPPPEEPGYSTALSRALNYINRAQKGLFLPGNSAARILVISGAPEVPAQYVPVMNCVFAAQKIRVPIDICYVAASEVSFLQQASQVTGGTYLRLERPQAMLQYLLSHFALDPVSRSMVRSGSVNDGRVPCFCHRKCIDMGFVCSVCLSIFCTKLDKCRTCGTQFAKAQFAAAAQK